MTVIAYWPTIADLHHHKRPSANTRTYVLWSVAGGISLLYGVFVLEDPLFMAVTGVIFLSNIVVLFLRLRLPH
jgi:hypothetical protein